MDINNVQQKTLTKLVNPTRLAQLTVISVAGFVGITTFLMAIITSVIQVPEYITPLAVRGALHTCTPTPYGIIDEEKAAQDLALRTEEVTVLIENSKDMLRGPRAMLLKDPLDARADAYVSLLSINAVRASQYAYSQVTIQEIESFAENCTN